MTAKVIDLESARLRRWERKQANPFQPRESDNLVWRCACGCWQYELRPIGVFCVSCGMKQSVAVKI